MNPATKAAPRASWPAQLRARLRRALAPPTVVLLYHRVLPAPGRDTNLLVTRTDHFAAHLAWLRSYCRPLSLPEFLRQFERPARTKLALDGGKPRVLITFDDGYADNVHYALPILAEHGVSAALFATSRMIGSAEPFWWDALDQIVFDGAPTADWHLPDGTLIPRAAPHSQTYWALMRALQPLSDLRRRAFLIRLAEQAGLQPRQVGMDRPLTWDELQRWQAAGLAIGGHTQSHARLSSLSTESVVTEITQCKRDLEARLEGRIQAMAYPYGGTADYDLRAEAAAQVAGFRCAFANVPGNARWARTAFSIPRCLVRDWPIDKFVAQFTEWSRE